MPAAIASETLGVPAGGDLVADLLQSAQQRLQLAGREQADVLQHPDVRHRAFDIVTCQPHVQTAVIAHRKAFDPFVGFETLVP